MIHHPFSVVTGAFGYTGGFIARELLEAGQYVETLTGHPDRPHPYGDRVTAVPYNFDNPRQLAESLRGATTLYNTYWIRFARGSVTFDQAVANSRVLFNAAREAGVSRLVHISVTDAGVDSSLPYFRGKALVEQAVAASGLAYTILRPALIFGAGDILLNNVAWLLRRFPIFAIPGTGEYRLQPIYGEDLARLAVAGAATSHNVTRDALGPEVFTFSEWLRLIALQLGRRPQFIRLPPRLALLLTRLVGLALRDRMLTSDELEALQSYMLVTDSPSLGTTRFSGWLEQNASQLGLHYASEIRRHF